MSKKAWESSRSNDGRLGWLYNDHQEGKQWNR